jgi:cytochrome bd ubiquinol oxidase subunit II
MTMVGGVLDLVPLWTAIIALGIFFYVLLDGFDLGVGMLYGLAAEEHRTTIMNNVAPVWDGNETWLILGGVALLAVFPLAFAIIILRRNDVSDGIREARPVGDDGI